MIIGPRGEILVEVGEEPDFIIAVIAKAQVEAVSRSMLSLTHVPNYSLANRGIDGI